MQINRGDGSTLTLNQPRFHSISNEFTKLFFYRVVFTVYLSGNGSSLLWFHRICWESMQFLFFGQQFHFSPYVCTTKWYDTIMRKYIGNWLFQKICHIQKLFIRLTFNMWCLLHLYMAQWITCVVNQTQCVCLWVHVLESLGAKKRTIQFGAKVMGLSK